MTAQDKLSVQDLLDLRRYQVSQEFFDVARERVAQVSKWGQQSHSPEIFLAILVEEVGELAEAMLSARFADQEGMHGSHSEDMYTEAKQVAAVALAFMEHLEGSDSDLYGDDSDLPEPNAPEPQRSDSARVHFRVESHDGDLLRRAAEGRRDSILASLKNPRVIEFASSGRVNIRATPPGLFVQDYALEFDWEL